MPKTIRLQHDRISNPQSITEETTKAFRHNDVDIHTHEVTSIEDDFKRGERVLTVKNTQYYSVGDIPWHKK